MKKLQVFGKVLGMFRGIVGYSMIAMAFALAITLVTTNAHATGETDITGVVDAVSGYWDAVVAVSIAILLFVVGRRVVRKL